jgi:hypothetical protein
MPFVAFGFFFDIIFRRFLMKRKLLSFLLLVCCFLGVSACNLQGDTSVSFTEEVKNAEVEKTTDDMVAIRVLKADGEESLMSVMEELQVDGLISFTVQAGMVTGINGKVNPADFSNCWMLYTSDAEMSNVAWGELEYDGQKLGSAMLGADALPVVEGGLYVWYYQAF